MNSILPNLISIAFVVVGAFVLFLSLLPTRKVVQITPPRMRAGWMILGGLIFFFLVGYTLFVCHLVSTSNTEGNLLVSSIMLGGSIFVLLVVQASLRSTEHISSLLWQDKYRALHDDLTDLPNRSLLEDRIDQTILLAKRKRETFAVLLVDLYRFKEVNEALSYSSGDYLLHQIAARLRQVVRASDTLARFGGDEFAVVLQCTNLDQAVAISMKIAQALEQTFSVDGQNITVCVNIGIAVYPEHGMDSETMLKHANIAAGAAKRNDLVYAVFDPENTPSSRGRLVLISDLRKAIAARELFLYYQPKIASHEGILCGVEALARWRHPVHGFIPPSEFIPIAEQAGLIKPLTRWVLEKALEQNTKWRQQGFCLPVSINLSVKNLHDLDFPKEVIAILDRSDSDPSSIKLEITESTMMADPKRVNEVIKRLHDMGFAMSIDDYGTGYSSLSYLRKFPAKEIKIDKSFITDMMQNEDNAVIVRSTIDMVHNIGRKVVAEGVEDENTLQMLRDLGCDVLQGFYIAHPLSAEEFTLWLQRCPWQIRRLESTEPC